MAVVSDIEIRLRADIARLQQDMNGARRTVDNAMGDIRSAANAAKAALAGIAAGIGLGQIAKLADEYAKFNAQLKLASLSQREYAAAYADVKRIANASTQGLGETGVLYARIANGTRELGTAQKQVAAITETVNLSLLVSGATAEEAASAQLQLSQAFASGTLRGEEFNAVNEAAPRLMLALADGIGVPVGQLKKMAEEGAITSKIMADVLPNALTKLRQEAKEVQTISGSFTVLRNSVMEFVGAQAQANGVAGIMSRTLGVLAENLSLVAGAVMTLIAAKLGAWLARMVTTTAQAITANRALAASNLATAQANNQAATTTAALANLRMAEVRASTLAASGEVQLALATNGLVPAQARAIAAEQARIASLGALTVAQRAASTATVAFNTVVATLGGPIGALITVLGLAATAWMVWSNRAKEANDAVKADVEETTVEMIARLDKQIEKLRERNRLAEVEPRVRNIKDLSEVDEAGLARARKRLEEVRAGVGEFANQSAAARSITEIDVLNNYETALLRIKSAQDEATAAAQRGERAKIGEFFGQQGSAAQRLAHELEEVKKKYGVLTPEMEKVIRAKYEDKKATKEVNQEMEKERELITELSGLSSSFSEDWNLLSKLYGKGKISLEQLTKAQEELLQKQPAIKAAADAEIKARSDLADFNKEYAKGLEAAGAAQGESIARARKEAEDQEELARAFGKTATELAALEVARIEEQLAQKYSLGLTLDEIEYLEELLVLKKRNAAAREGLDDMKERADEWKDFEQTARDTFRSIADGSKDTAQRLKETFKNVFFDWLYQMTLKKWIIQLQPVSAGGGGLLDAAQSAFGKADGAGQGLLDAGKTIYQGFSKNFASTFGPMISKFGETFGLKAVQTYGANMASGAGSAGGAAGGATAIPIAGAIIAGMMANNKFFEEGWRLDAKDIMSSQLKSMWKGNGFAPLITTMTASMNVFEKAMKGLGVNAKFASMLSGSSVFARAFGRKQATVEAQGFEGTISTGGFDGKAFAEMLSKGGWFRSDKRSTSTQALDSGQDAAFDSTIKSVVDSVRGMGEVLGLEASRIDGYSKQIKLTLGKDEAENQKLIEAAFGGLADDLSALMLPNLAEFAQSGETAGETLQRVAGNFQMVTAALDVMNTTSERAFGSIGVASLAARERLVELAGGVESLVSQTSFFSQNFLTEAERLAPVQRMVTEQLATLGRSGITTAADFKAAVLDLTTGGKLATEEGARTYAGLLAIAPGFKLITDAAANAAQAMADKAAELAQFTEDERRGLQDELDSLTMTSEQLLKKQWYALQESNRGLFDQINALKAHQAATNAAAADLVIATQAIEDARVKGIADALDAGDKLIAGAESAFAVLQRVASEEKAMLSEAHTVAMSRLQIEIDAQTDALSKHKALSDALRSTIGSMGGGNPGMERGAAQAQVKMALAMARAGAMPLVETLKDSLSVLSRDSTDLFDSLEDYQRDFYRTQNDLIELAAVSDAALSVDEKQLRALQSTQAKAEEAFKREIAAIDATLVAAQASLDTLRGISTTGLTIVDALNALRLAIVAAEKDKVAGSLSQINQAYQDSLQRAPDAAGMEFWKERIASGVDIKAVVDGIKNSEEAKIRELYKELLGRTADAPGLKFFMDSGATLEGIRAAIIQSDEYRTRTAAVYTTQQNTIAAASQTSAAAMITELQTLNGRMANVEVAIMNTEQNTRQFAAEFNSVSNGGESLFVEAPTYAPV